MLDIPLAPLDYCNSHKDSVDWDNHHFLSRVEQMPEAWTTMYENLCEQYGEPRFGTSRMMFQVSDTKVLKLAHNVRGIRQNLVEVKESQFTKDTFRGCNNSEGVDCFEDFVVGVWRETFLENSMVPTVPTEVVEDETLERGVLISQDLVLPVGVYLSHEPDEDAPEDTDRPIPEVELEFWLQVCEYSDTDEVQIGYHSPSGTYLAYDF